MTKTHIPILIAGALLLGAWGPAKIAAPSSMTAPTPIEGSAGQYASPYTSDGVTAGWVTKSMQVKAASQVGTVAGNYMGQKAAERIPFVGGMIGKKVGAMAGRSMALESIGGEAFIKSSTDLSFNSLSDMAIYMYVNYSATPDYQKVLEATYAIYPEFQAAYTPALQAASAGR
jgi:hypothetical protein